MLPPPRGHPAGSQRGFPLLPCPPPPAPWHLSGGCTDTRRGCGPRSPWPPSAVTAPQPAPPATVSVCRQHPAGNKMRGGFHAHAVTKRPTRGAPRPVCGAAWKRHRFPRSYQRREASPSSEGRFAWPPRVGRVLQRDASLSARSPGRCHVAKATRGSTQESCLPSPVPTAVAAGRAPGRVWSQQGT